MHWIKLYTEFQQAIGPYLFFWDEWCRNGNCNLASHEIKIIEKYLQNSSEVTLYNEQNGQGIIEIKTVIRKLEFGYPVFKEYVIVNFLYSIITYANEYGYHNFLKTPIHQLNIDEDVKACLKRLNTFNLQIAFIIYKPVDFHRKWLYDIIVQFQTIKTKKHILNIGTSTLVATRPHK